jgi:hypothetical protein
VDQVPTLFASVWINQNSFAIFVRPDLIRFIVVAVIQ